MGLLSNLVDEVNDFMFENIDSQDIDATTKRMIKKRVTLMILIIGILLTPAYFYATSWVFGVDPKDHWTFLQSKDPYEERYRLLQYHLDQVNKEINKYEKISLDRQKDLFESLEVNIKNPKDRTEALRIVNRTQDIITKLMELGKFFVVLVKHGDLDEPSQEALQLMYEGWLDILVSERDSSAISKAVTKYKKVYNEHINDFPEELRDDVRIEVLNILTYGMARMGYPKESKRYLTEAKKLLNDSISPIDYRRKYYWINFAEFIDAVSHLEHQKADDAFNTLKTKLNDQKFLRAKILQHSGLVTNNDQKQMIEMYLRSTYY